MTTGWRERGGATYYFDENGKMATGSTWIDGRLYYFSAGGILRKDNGWFRDGAGNYYLFNEDYSLTTGWRERGGNLYYFDNNGVMATYNTKVGDKAYYFTAGGFLYKGIGWYKDAFGNYFLFNSDGSLTTGWRERGGNLYYFHEDGVMATYNTRIGDKAYYFTAGGILYKGEGWLKDDDDRYFLFNSDGSLATGWKERGGSTYYFEPDGVMVTGKKVIDGEEYYFTPGGQLGTLDPMVARAQGYSSATQYLIMVDTSRHVVGVFEGSQGNWELIDMFPCGDGAPETPTPLGVFDITERFVYFDSGSARCWYATGFVDSYYLFHSILYYQESAPITVMDPTVGQAVSHGCVRLPLAKCKWIYDNVPRHSAVVIYR